MKKLVFFFTLILTYSCTTFVKNNISKAKFEEIKLYQNRNTLVAQANLDPIITAYSSEKMSADILPFDERNNGEITCYNYTFVFQKMDDGQEVLINKYLGYPKDLSEEEKKIVQHDNRKRCNSYGEQGKRDTESLQVLGQAFINSENQRREDMKQSSEEYLRHSREIERDNRVITTDCTFDKNGDSHCQSR